MSKNHDAAAVANRLLSQIFQRSSKQRNKPICGPNSSFCTPSTTSSTTPPWQWCAQMTSFLLPVCLSLSCLQIEHSADAWDHDQFKDVVVRVANLEIVSHSPVFLAEHATDLVCSVTVLQGRTSRLHNIILHSDVIALQALTFYLQENPTLITDLLTALSPRIDHSRVVRMFSNKSNDNVPIIKSYLIAVQHVSTRFTFQAIVSCVLRFVLALSTTSRRSTRPTTSS